MKTKILASLVVGLSTSAKAEDPVPQSADTEALIQSLEQAKITSDITAEEFIQLLEAQGINVESLRAADGTDTGGACW